MDPRDFEISRLNENSITLSGGNRLDDSFHRKLIGMKNWLRNAGEPGISDIITAYNSITLIFDYYHLRKTKGKAVYEDLKQLLETAYKNSDFVSANSANLVNEIPVCYDAAYAPDIELISARNKIPVDEIIKIHTRTVYTVYMIGFLPGFPYMGRLDPGIRFPRKEKPRLNVPAGSVGIAGIQTGIYPQDSPGGWQIIGRTPVALFRKEDSPPVILQPGDRVQFYPISKKQFEEWP
jgi:inhibitor of KinA